jgi:hypothetical protein
MEGNARTWFTPKQRAELWERWKRDQCMADIARDSRFGRGPSPAVSREAIGHSGLTGCGTRSSVPRVHLNCGVRPGSLEAGDGNRLDGIANTDVFLTACDFYYGAS